MYHISAGDSLATRAVSTHRASTGARMPLGMLGPMGAHGFGVDGDLSSRSPAP
jgi:hypothetical protein